MKVTAKTDLLELFLSPALRKLSIVLHTHKHIKLTACYQKIHLQPPLSAPNSRSDKHSGLTNADLPAVNHNWPSKGRIQRLDLLQEFQHPNRCERHPEIRPAGEVELRHEPQRLTAIVELQGIHGLWVWLSFSTRRFRKELSGLFMTCILATPGSWLHSIHSI